MKNKNVIVIIGPTASGKSDLSIQVAKKLDGEVISADSSQVYVGLDIGSAKIKKEEMQSIKHYMIDIKQANEDFCVAEFKELALKNIQDILSKNKTPIICGGTGLYVRALIDDYDFDFTPKSEELRAKIEKEIEENGIDFAYQMLKSLSMSKASKINPNDKVRLVRALEKELCEKQTTKQLENDFNYFVYVIDMDRTLLYQRINDRVDKMVEIGLFDEVKNLMEKGITTKNSCFKSIGYKEVYDYYANGTLDKQQTIELIKKKTRNYAKRQLTFFRGIKQAVWLRSDDKLSELLQDYNKKA